MTKLMTEFNKLLNNPEYWENGELMDGDIRDTLADMFPKMNAADLGHALDVIIAFNADFQAVQWMINSNDMDGAIAKIKRMDTEPREQIIMAIADEYGNGYLETVIGYVIA